LERAAAAALVETADHQRAAAAADVRSALLKFLAANRSPSQSVLAAQAGHPQPDQQGELLLLAACSAQRAAAAEAQAVRQQRAALVAAAILPTSRAAVLERLLEVTLFRAEGRARQFMATEKHLAAQPQTIQARVAQVFSTLVFLTPTYHAAPGPEVPML
jgi:hypothetical protein